MAYHDRLCLQDSSSPTEQRTFLRFISSIRDLLRRKEASSVSPGPRWEDGVSEAEEVKLAALQRKDMDDCSPGLQSPLLCDWLHDSIHDRDNSPMMRAVLRGSVCKVYRFRTEAGLWVLVREQMSESALSFSLPKQLLALYTQDHTRRVQELEDLSDLTPNWEGLRRDVMTHHNQLIACYQDTLTQLNRHTSSSPSFKPSVCKTDRHLQFVPINLHTQRMSVTCPTASGDVWYEVVTLGAPADHVGGFKHGGLHRLISTHHYHNSAGVFFSPEEVSRARALLSSVAQLQALVSGQAEQLLLASLELSAQRLQQALDSLTHRTVQLVHALTDELVKSALLALHTVKPAHLSDGHAPVTTGNGTADSSANKDAPQQGGHAYQEREFDEEEWDRVWANIGISLNCIIAMVDRLQGREVRPQEVTSEQGREARPQEVTSEQRRSTWDTNCHNTDWRAQLLPLVVTLRECVEEAGWRVRGAMSLVLLQGALSSAGPPGPRLCQRRDSVFSQALAALVSGVVLRLYAGLEDRDFLQQLVQMGVLVQFEGLLSTYGDEEGMMEDMEVGVSDLSSVFFTLTQAATSDPSDLQPCLTGQRGSVTVQVPLPPDTFSTLPWQLKDGHLLRVHPVLFNIGINQQQSLAERFGDSSHQERINQRSCEMMKTYYSRLREKLPSLCVGSCVEELLDALEVSLGSRRRKNVEVLWLAATICRRLNGVRLTCCKSGKDRTSMSVTLEQCVLLRDRHGVSKEHFSTALDCMRREGCRMENVQKNTGSRKYAFHSIQLLTFPKLYRPPEHCYGKNDT